MNIKIDLDITPEEFRTLMGLPDVQGFQQDLMDKVKEQMQAGAAGYDPLTLLKPYLAGSFASMDGLQKFMHGLITNYTAAGTVKKTDD